MRITVLSRTAWLLIPIVLFTHIASRIRQRDSCHHTRPSFHGGWSESFLWQGKHQGEGEATNCSLWGSRHQEGACPHQGCRYLGRNPSGARAWEERRHSHELDPSFRFRTSRGICGGWRNLNFAFRCSCRFYTFRNLAVFLLIWCFSLLADPWLAQGSYRQGLGGRRAPWYPDCEKDIQLLPATWIQHYRYVCILSYRTRYPI